jgi:phosphoribosylformylglycinamidine cyclo-ligase
MGTGFVLVTPQKEAEDAAAMVDGRVIGRVEEGSGVVVDGVEL